jgi:hypothetical protein
MCAPCTAVTRSSSTGSRPRSAAIIAAIVFGSPAISLAPGFEVDGVGAGASSISAASSRQRMRRPRMGEMAPPKREALVCRPAWDDAIFRPLGQDERERRFDGDHRRILVDLRWRGSSASALPLHCVVIGGVFDAATTAGHLRYRRRARPDGVLRPAADVRGRRRSPMRQVAWVLGTLDMPVAIPPCRRRRKRSSLCPMRSVTNLAVTTLAAALCAAGAFAQEAPGVVKFSSAKPGTELPKGWEVAKISDTKKPTEYKFVENDGKVVLEAKAAGAASGLAQRMSVDVKEFPRVEWRWKVSRLIEAADNSQSKTEDSPVRLVFEFDGDKKKLSFGERAQLSLAEGISGRESPYATLMYIWSNKVPVGTVVPNPRTNRVQMVVASSGPAGVYQWGARATSARL